MASTAKEWIGSNSWVSCRLEVYATANTVGNYSDVTVYLYGARNDGGNSYNWDGSNFWININGTQTHRTSGCQVSGSGWQLVHSQTTRVYHNDDGSKSISVSAGGGINGTTFQMGSNSVGLTLDKIARKSTMSVSDGALGTAQTLKVTRQSTSYTHTITYVCGEASGTVCTKSSTTSIAWTPPLTLANQNPDGENVKITFTIETFNGSTSLGTNAYAIYCMLPKSYLPTVSFTVTDDTWYLSKYTAYVQGRSKIKVTISAAGVYGSSITGYSTTVDGKTYTANSFTTEVIARYGMLEISVTVTDSRGRSTLVTKEIQVLAYEKPKLEIKQVRRCDSSGNSNSSGAYLAVDFDASITPLNAYNSSAFVLTYNKVTSTSVTNKTLSDFAGMYLVDGGTVVFAADTSSSYDVELKVTDDFETVSAHGSGTSITKLFSWLAKGLGWAFGKVAEKENALEIAWDIFDKYDTKIGNGLACYTGSGTTAIDPNTTLEHVVLTNKNTPTSAFYYVITYFYNTKTETANKTQIAIPYNASSAGSYYRYMENGTWTAWTNDALKAYPVGSIHIRFDHTSPASLFGGEWTRVIHTSTGAGAFLYGSTEAAVIGEEGGEAAHTLTINEMPNHNHNFDTITSGGAGANYGYPTGSLSSAAWVRNHSLGMTYVGGGKPHNNIPPFVKVSIWRRVA